MPVGRNDPCPCGSGKRYKKCHGALERAPVDTSSAAARATVLKDADVRLGDHLVRFARQRYGPRWLSDILDVVTCDGVSFFGGVHSHPLPPRHAEAVTENTDGDPFLLTKDDFVLTGEQSEVARRLASPPGVQDAEPENADTVFTVTMPGNGVHRAWDNTVVGRMILSDARLTLETNSTRRADTLRATPR